MRNAHSVQPCPDSMFKECFERELTFMIYDFFFIALVLLCLMVSCFTRNAIQVGTCHLYPSRAIQQHFNPLFCPGLSPANLYTLHKQIRFHTFMLILASPQSVISCLVFYRFLSSQANSAVDHSCSICCNISFTSVLDLLLI